MCTEKVLFCPSNNDVRQIKKARKTLNLSFFDVRKLVDAIRFVANGKDISIADATDLMRQQGVFEHVYNRMNQTPDVSSRQLANLMRKHFNTN